MRIILLGPPGAGKGTQAEMLADKWGIAHISTGEMFRSAINNGSELGKKAKSFMDAGQLVPDEITVEIVRDRLSESDCTRGFLLDGFPRTTAQADNLEEILKAMNVKLDAVINIQSEREALIARLTGRRICRGCGATYHIVFNPPQQITLCDKCDGELYQREDDSLGTVVNRLDVYDRQTEPLIQYYREKGLLRNINGMQAIGAVFDDIIKALGRESK